MPRLQDASSVVDQLTRFKLKLLEKRLDNKKQNMDNRAESAQSARSYDGQMDALYCALRRKQTLLQRLREQHMLEDLNRPHTWGGSQRKYQPHFVSAHQLPPPLPPMESSHIPHPAPVLPSLPLAPPAQFHPPRIIQQTLPQQPATIIQQLPQQPLISQIPSPQSYTAPRSNSIKEDMVELMLMQNAQMHQIIMHNMMLKAMPPMTMLPPGGSSHYVNHTYHGQNSYQGSPVRPDIKARGSSVHHHHHYGATPAVPQLPPINYPFWQPGVSSIPVGQARGHLPFSHHVTTPITLPPLNV